MSEREFEQMNTNTAENTQPVNDDYEDISSSSSPQPQNSEEMSSVKDESDPQVAQVQQYPQYQQPYHTEQQFQSSQPQQSSEYERYVAQFNMQQAYSMNNGANRLKQNKKSGVGKKATLIACSIALALCVGIGGGVVGAMVASGNTVQTSTVTSGTNSQKATAKTANGDDSGLTIVQSNNTSSKATTIEEVVAKVKDSVVEITTESTSYDTFYGQYVSQGAGSGVIISEDGYIITNNHVIEGANTITVKTTDGKSYKATLVGTDATLDVALIKIEASGLTVAEFGDSEKLNVGQTAIAIGNPLGELGGTVTNGIISALNREIQIDGKTMDLLQTDAAINPGNSGGGLFDANGNLIGIVVAKSATTSSGTAVEGLGFAIPVNNIKDILGDLKTSGHVTGRASLDITAVDVDNDSKLSRYNVTEKGVYIYSLKSGGAAETAGLKVGDRIVKVGDKEVSSTSELKSALSKLKAGNKTDIVVSRDGKEQTINITLGEASSETETSNSNNFNADGGYDSYYGNDDLFGGFGIG